MYRAHAVRCPRCRTEPLDEQVIRSCRGCGGQWIGEDVLAERVAKMRETTQGTIAWAPASRAALPCASCEQPMDTLVYGTIEIDRCRRHGVWFDRNELGALLLLSAAAPATVAATARAGAGAGTGTGTGAGAVAGAATSANATAAPAPTMDDHGAGDLAVGTALELGAGALELVGDVLELIGDLLGGLGDL